MNSIDAESMVFYRSYMEAVKRAGLTPEERCEFYEGIILYATAHVLPEFSNPILEGFFVICKENINANVRKCQRRLQAVENGKKGGVPKGNKNEAKHKCKKDTDKQKDLLKTVSENNPKTTPKTTINVNDTVTETNTVTLTDTFSSFKENKKKRQERKEEQADRDLRCAKIYDRLLPSVEPHGIAAIQDFHGCCRERREEHILLKEEMVQHREIPSSSSSP